MAQAFYSQSSDQEGNSDRNRNRTGYPLESSELEEPSKAVSLLAYGVVGAGVGIGGWAATKAWHQRSANLGGLGYSMRTAQSGSLLKNTGLLGLGLLSLGTSRIYSDITKESNKVSGSTDSTTPTTITPTTIAPTTSRISPTKPSYQINNKLEEQVKGSSYIATTKYGSKMSEFFTAADKGTLVGGFYEDPIGISSVTGRPIKENYLDKASRTTATIVSNVNGDNAELIKELKKAGVPTVSSSRQYHLKAFTAEAQGRKVGFVGTGNPTTTGLTNTPTNSRDTQQRGAIYEFKKLWGRITGEKVSAPLTQINIGMSITAPSQVKELEGIYKDIATTGKARSTNNFIVGGPNSGGPERLQKLIEGGAVKGQKIQVTGPYLDDPKIVNALLYAHSQGASVEVISSNPNSNIAKASGGAEQGVRTALARLSGVGIKVYTPGDDQAVLPHLKSLRVGGTLAIGSHNFTAKIARGESMEIMALTQNKSDIQAYEQDMARIVSEGFVSEYKPNKADKRIAATEAARTKAVAAGVDNPGLAALFDDTGEMGNIIVPSKMGASYHYAVALHNTAMKQAGYNGEVITSSDMGIMSSVYQIANIAAGESNKPIPSSVQQYDKEIQEGGLGMWLNENVFMPNGWGRLYKDEDGFLPSIAGFMGAALDKGYLFYSANLDPYNSYNTEDLRSGVGYGNLQEKKGFFEGLAASTTTLALGSASAAALYLAVGEPVNLLIGEFAKTSTENFLNEISSDTDFDNNIRKAGRASQFGAGSFGAKDSAELKFNLGMRIEELKAEGKSFYSPENFQLTGYHYNALYFREKAGRLLENTLKPFLIEYVSPFTPGTDAHNKFITSIDKLITAIKSPPELELHSTMTGEKKLTVAAKELSYAMSDTGQLLNYRKDIINTYLEVDSTGQYKFNAAARQEAIDAATSKGLVGQALDDAVKDAERFLVSELQVTKELGLRLGGVGATRQSTVAYALQEVLDIMPLNPLHWSLFSGLKDGQEYAKVGDIFSFDKAATYMQKLLLSREGLGAYMQKNEVLVYLGNGDYRVDKVGQFGRMMTNIVGDVYTSVKNQWQAGKQIRKLSNELRTATDQLASTGNLSWDELTEANKQVIPIMDAVGDVTLAKGTDELLDAHLKYDAFYEQAGMSQESLKRVRENIEAVGSVRLGRDLARGKKSKITGEIFKTKWALALVLGLDASLIGNELFQSTSGVSLWTQFTTARETGEKKISVEFSGNRLQATTGIMTPITTLMGAGIITYGAYHMALATQEQMLENVSYPEEVIKHKVDKEGWKLIEDPTLNEYKLHKPNIDPNTGKPLIDSVTGEEVLGKGIRLIKTELSDEVASAALNVGDNIPTNVKKFAYVNANPIIRTVIDNVAIKTALFTGVGLLAVGGVKNSIASVLNASRDTTGTVDPLVFGTGGAIAGGMLTKNFYGTVAGAAIGAVTSTMANWAGIKLFNIGGKGTLIDPLNTQAAAQMAGFKNLVMERMAAGENVSELEMMGGYYAGEMAKTISTTQAKQERMVNVIARQAPMPMLQFFLAEQTKGRKYDDNGQVIEGSGITSYTTGIQAAPITGFSMSVALPFSVYRDGGEFGIVYNPENNLLNVTQIAATLTMASTTILGGSSIVSGLMAKAFRAVKLEDAAFIMDDAAKATAQMNKFGLKVASWFDVFTTTSIRNVASLGTADIMMTKRLLEIGYNNLAAKNSTVAMNTASNASVPLFRQPLAVARYGGAMLAGYLVGSFVASAAHHILADDKAPVENKSLEVIGGVSGAVTAAMAPLIYSKMAEQLTPSLVNSNTGKLVGSLIKKAGPLNRALIPALLFGTIASFLTSSNFGFATGMDKKRVLDENGNQKWDAEGKAMYESDLLHQAGVVTLLASTGTVGALEFGKFGYSNSDTLEEFAKVLERKELGKTRKYWDVRGKFHDWAISKEATYIMQTGITNFRTLLNEEPDLKTFEHFGKRNQGAINKIKAGDWNKLSTEEIKLLREDIVGYKQPIPKSGPPIPGGIGQAGNMTEETVEGMASITKRTRALSKMTFIGVGTRRVSLASAVATGLGWAAHAIATEGGETSEWINKGYRTLDQIGGIASIVADALRIATNTDSISTGIIDGKQFARGSMRTGGDKLLNPNDKDFNAFGKMFKDIRGLMVLDEPNPFFTLFNVGTTFRQGDQGQRQTFYFQMQSAGQDVSSAAYSMSNSFFFQQAAAGNAQLGIQTQIAQREMAEAVKSGKKDQLTQSRIRNIAFKLLGVTSKLQPLQKARKVSKIDESTMGLANRDSLVSMMLADRSHLTRHMSFQPGQSLASQMVIQAMTKHPQGNLSKLLPGVFSGKKDALNQLFGDAFGNKKNETRFNNLTWFKQGKTVKSTKGSGGQYFTEPSQWAEYSSIEANYFNTDKDNALGKFISSIPTVLSFNLPGIIGTTVASILGISLGIGAIGVLAGAALPEKVKAMGADIDEVFNKSWFGSGGSQEKHLQFKVDPMRDVDGKTKHAELPAPKPQKPVDPTFIGPPEPPLPPPVARPRMQVVRGNSIFEMSGAFYTEDYIKMHPDMHTKLNRGMAKLEAAATSSYMTGFGADGSKSMLEHMSSDEFQMELKQVHAEYQAELRATGRTVSDADLTKQAIENLTEKYKSQVRTFVDNYFTNMLEVEIEVNGKKYPMVAVLDPDFNPVNWDNDPLGSQKKLYGIVENLKKGILEGSADTPGSGMYKKLSDLINKEVRIKGNTLDSRLINSLVGDNLDSHMKVLTARVLQELKTTRELINLQNSLGGLLRSIDDKTAKDMVQSLLNRVKNGSSKIKTGVLKFRSGFKLDPSVGSAPSRTKTQPFARALGKVKGRLGLVEGLGKLGQFVGFAMDTIDTINIFAAAMRVAEGYDSDTTSIAEMTLKKKELGDTAMKLASTIIIGSSVAALAPVAMSVAGATGLSLSTLALGTVAASTGSLTTLGVLAIGTTASIALGALAIGVGGYVVWRNIIKPGLDHFLKTDIGKETVKGVGKAFTWVADNVGEVLGGWIPQIGGIPGKLLGNKYIEKRGKAIATGAVAGSLAGVGMTAAVIGVGGLAAAVGATGIAATAAAITTLALPIIASVAVAGALAATINSKGVSNFFGGIVNSISKIEVGGVPIGAWLAPAPGSVGDQQRFGFKQPGSPFFMGSPLMAIKSEYSDILEGRSPERLFASDSVYGAGGSDSAAKQVLSRTVGSIRPTSLVDGPIGRELSIRSQYYRSSIVGSYMWRATAAGAANSSEMQRAAKRWQHTKSEMSYRSAQRQLSYIKSQVSVKMPPSRGLIKALKDEKIVAQMVNVSTMIQAQESAGRKVASAVVSNNQLTTRSIDSFNQDIGIVTKHMPVIKKDTNGSNIAPGSVNIKKETAKDNDVLSASSQYLLNKIQPQYQHV